MIYAKIHDYEFPDGIPQQCVAARQDQFDDTWLPFDVPDQSWLSLVAGKIVVASSSSINVPPDGLGFANAVKAEVGGIVEANLLMRAYPAFFPAIQEGNWPDLQTLILDAQKTGIINATQYATMKAAATQFNIPVTLP